MLRCAIELCMFGEPLAPSAPDSGDISGEVNMGGLTGWMVWPDMAGLWYGLAAPTWGPGWGDLVGFELGDRAPRGDLGGVLGLTLRYRDGASRGEGRLRGTMKRSRSLSQSTGSMRGADSLVMELSLGLNSMLDRR